MSEVSSEMPSVIYDRDQFQGNPCGHFSKDTANINICLRMLRTHHTNFVLLMFHPWTTEWSIYSCMYTSKINVCKKETAVFLFLTVYRSNNVSIQLEVLALPAANILLTT
ncbi:hypothetical protein XENOCAPTIV_017079 [Xenoophorus captivus]|uniref:Uncharacterized protein n=1 Tax=Xenoophorus captivus TaxID=1517983 RepID=A0ABV0QVQ8_9TELE